MHNPAVNLGSKSDVLIVGGGVIGMATAHELSRRGAAVTLVERGEPGCGCSYGNAGWITPALSLPLPMPGMLFKTLGWMLDPESPLHIEIRPSWHLARWLLRFLRSMNHAHMVRSVDALTRLTRYGLDVYARLEQETGHATGYRQSGLLVVTESDAGLDAAQRVLELAGRNGIPGRHVDEAEVLSLEPALASRMRGGVLFPEEAHAEPLELVRALTAGAEKHGARILTGHEVFAFRTSRGRITAVETTRGVLTAERFVLATGSWSAPLGRRLGLEIPVLGGKGYALVVPALDPMPRRPLMLLEKKIAVTPRSGSLRLAGTLELVDGDESITARRVAAILNGARRFLALPETPPTFELWRGLRPCTPDGVPIIGLAPRYGNLLIATGHQMLGVQSAPGTARLAADLLLGEPPAFDPAPFRADRF